MKNNSIGTVAVSNTKRSRARFNLSSDVHTSMDFGSVVPSRCHLMVPNSKVVASSKERILCSPMLAPTMGRMSMFAYHNFVRMSDIFPNFSAMMAQESISRNGAQFVPQYVPICTVRDLSALVLFGAYLNVYKRNTTGTADDAIASGCQVPVYSGTTGVLSSDPDLGALSLFTKFNSSFFGINSFFLSFKFLFNDPSSTSTKNFPLSNPTNATFYSIDPTCDFYKDNKDWYDLSDVTPQNADYVVPTTLSNGDTYYLCFRLSDMGKRLRKILIGCGYQINFTDTTIVSVLPLVAFFKSYFDVFGLTLYNNWEETYCSRFLTFCDNVPSPSVVNLWLDSTSLSSLDNASSFFYYFVFRELASTFFTDEQDFVSSHTRSTAVSPTASGILSSIDTDVDSSNSFNPNVSSVLSSNEPPSFTYLNGHSFINDTVHGQLDSELLKRLYRWTNRNTIAGRRIAELLRAQGLGAYVDECQSDFIGSFEVPIAVYDGISQSDTFDSVADSGAPLGERFGNGQAQSDSSAERSFTFECNEFGYWITLISIVPKGGYAEALDPTVMATSKFQFYNPEFDSLGYEFSKKSLVCASQPFVDWTAANGKLSDSFGLCPRYFPWKFGKNVANGDFTRRGARDSFAAYYLDKVIDVGSRLIRPLSLGANLKGYTLVKEFTPVDLPIAGYVWRYPTRYPFISRYNRIFNYSFADREHRSMSSVADQAAFELFSNSPDNFILHMIWDIQYFAPMLPVQDSFETYDDDNAPNASMSKA